MDEQALSDLISKTAMLMEKFERNCTDIDQRQQALAQQLSDLTQRLPQVVRQSAESSLQVLPGEVLGKVQSGLEQPVSQYEKRLNDAGTKVNEGSGALAQQLQRMEKLHKQLVWKTAAVAVGSMLLVLVGGIWLSSHYYGIIREYQLSADLLKAYNRADVTLCGKNGEQLCANVDREAQGYGDQGQYVPVKPR
jgi:ElaB/YqjD/DUF883 family membrane-anchored ribosome-binding protein